MLFVGSIQTVTYDIPFLCTENGILLTIHTMQKGYLVAIKEENKITYTYFAAFP